MAIIKPLLFENIVTKQLSKEKSYESLKNEVDNLIDNKVKLLNDLQSFVKEKELTINDLKNKIGDSEILKIQYQVKKEIYKVLSDRLNIISDPYEFFKENYLIEFNESE